MVLLWAVPLKIGVQTSLDTTLVLSLEFRIPFERVSGVVRW